jgi:hypothetical protein
LLQVPFKSIKCNVFTRRRTISLHLAGLNVFYLFALEYLIFFEEAYSKLSLDASKVVVPATKMEEDPEELNEATSPLFKSSVEADGEEVRLEVIFSFLYYRGEIDRDNFSFRGKSSIHLNLNKFSIISIFVD